MYRNVDYLSIFVNFAWAIVRNTKLSEYETGRKGSEKD